MEYYKNSDLKSIKYEENGVLKEEIWKDIPGFSAYRVSDLGRVRSLDRVMKTITGRTYTYKGIIKKPDLRKGYCAVSMTTDDFRYLKMSVHKLVMISFIGHSDLVIDHINEIKHDNRFVNLRYCTIRENSNYHLMKNSNKRKKSLNIGVRSVGKRYESRMVINKKSIHIGYYNSNEEAGKAYIDAIFKYDMLGKKPEPLVRKSSSKYKNVNFVKKRNRWRVSISENNKRYFVGEYKTEEEAYQQLIEYKKSKKCQS